jgi:DNA modification methylase
MKDIKEFLGKFLTGKSEDVLSQMPSESIDLVVTSPP